MGNADGFQPLGGRKRMVMVRFTAENHPVGAAVCGSLDGVYGIAADGYG